MGIIIFDRVKSDPSQSSLTEGTVAYYEDENTFLREIYVGGIGNVPKLFSTSKRTITTNIILPSTSDQATFIFMKEACFISSIGGATSGAGAIHFQVHFDPVRTPGGLPLETIVDEVDPTDLDQGILNFDSFDALTGGEPYELNQPGWLWLEVLDVPGVGILEIQLQIEYWIP